MKLSVIVPCYNEEKNINSFYTCISQVLSDIKKNVQGGVSAYEILFINDGSQDDTLKEIKKLSTKDPDVYYISFARNFGKESAMLAGLRHCTGDYVVIIDVDLQDPPQLIEQMLSIITNGEGYECVATRRVDRKGEPPIRSFFADLFYKIINSISDVKIVSGSRDFRLMTRKMVDSLLQLKEKNRFSKGLFVWAGYKTYYIEFSNQKRSSGRSKWSFWTLFKYSIDGIIAFSTVPLQIASILGLICCVGSLFSVLYFVIQKFIGGIQVQGYAMLICSLFLLGGIQLLSLGIIGQYIGKIFIESKHRPDYVILENNIDDDKG